MKGGVTSGVTYPLAINELARKFHLKNLGGTSAGAIAAACAAAAEFRRRHSPDFDDMKGFKILEELPMWLGTREHLLQLFRPDASTKVLFDLALKGATYHKARLPRILLRCFRHWPWALALSLLPGLVLIVISLAVGLWESQPALPILRLPAGGTGLRVWFLLTGISGGLFLALSLPAWTLLGRLRAQLRSMVDNNFALSSGMAAVGEDEAPSLTLWLHAKLNEVAGVASGRPLTFGDLWASPVPPAGRHLLKNSDRSIDLKMITTAITHGRPYELPFRKNSLYFQREEMEKLFPGEVVQWMIDHPRPARGDDRVDTDGWYHLPEARDLPVVVATRMSLSFPGLISAVPLGRVDFDRQLTDGQKHAPETVWFSDGGISSNFPIHFFDAMVPRWPTIGINLRQFSADPSTDRGARDRDNVYAIRRRSDGVSEQWRRIYPDTPLAMMIRFFGAVLNTMQNWYDNSYLPLPGYRDRVVEIWQTKYEGGLNLDMDRRTVKHLSHKGLRAGQLMAARFSRPSTSRFQLGWDDHRWTRYRSVMAAMAETNRQLYRVLYRSDDWESLVLRGDDIPPIGSRFDSPSQGAQAWKATNDLLDLYDEWKSMGTSVDPHLGPFRGAPHPRVRMGIRVMN